MYTYKYLNSFRFTKLTMCIAGSIIVVPELIVEMLLWLYYVSAQALHIRKLFDWMCGEWSIGSFESANALVNQKYVTNIFWRWRGRGGVSLDHFSARFCSIIWAVINDNDCVWNEWNNWHGRQFKIVTHFYKWSMPLPGLFDENINLY